MGAHLGSSRQGKYTQSWGSFALLLQSLYFTNSEAYEPNFSPVSFSWCLWPFQNCLGIKATNLVCLIDCRLLGTCSPCCYCVFLAVSHSKFYTTLQAETHWGASWSSSCRDMSQAGNHHTDPRDPKAVFCHSYASELYGLRHCWWAWISWGCRSEQPHV